MPTLNKAPYDNQNRGTYRKNSVCEGDLLDLYGPTRLSSPAGRWSRPAGSFFYWLF